jgi:hypothetical protein
MQSNYVGRSLSVGSTRPPRSSGRIIEAQEAEETEELDEDNVVRASFGASFDSEGPEAA